MAPYSSTDVNWDHTSQIISNFFFVKIERRSMRINIYISRSFLAKHKRNLNTKHD